MRIVHSFTQCFHLVRAEQMEVSWDVITSTVRKKHISRRNLLLVEQIIIIILQKLIVQVT